jgi:acetyl-CoA carboxylase biotin carboxyl carrier protein
MEFKEIQELIKLVSKTNISGIKIKQGDFEIHIKNQVEQVAHAISVPQGQHVLPQVVTYAPAQPAQTALTPAQETAAEAQKEEAKQEAAAAANTFTFRSPMIGTFYRKPGPDKDLFVKVGDTIKNGDVLCIIEAMKLFNEIEFDGGEGKVVKILVDDSSPVEYDQPLFLIEKIG